METHDLVELAKIRVAVGFLGEKDQFGWWSSSFLANASAAFAAPLFPRTQFLAQCQGVVAAASRVHDERIGVGQVYHLFRLPEEIEQALHRLLHDPDAVQRVKDVVTNADVALAALREQKGSAEEGSIGPTRMGDFADLRALRGWQNAAAAYVDGFDNGTQVYPYFTGAK